MLSKSPYLLRGEKKQEVWRCGGRSQEAEPTGLSNLRAPDCPHCPRTKAKFYIQFFLFRTARWVSRSQNMDVFDDLEKMSKEEAAGWALPRPQCPGALSFLPSPRAQTVPPTANMLILSPGPRPQSPASGFLFIPQEPLPLGLLCQSNQRERGLEFLPERGPPRPCP